MKAYYKNGRVCFAEPKRRKIKFLIPIMVIILIVFSAFSFGKSEFKHECGIEIPGIEGRFCTGFEKTGNMFFENEKLKIIIK